AAWHHRPRDAAHLGAGVAEDKRGAEIAARAVRVRRVSRAQRSTKRSEVVRCSPGTPVPAADKKSGSRISAAPLRALTRFALQRIWDRAARAQFHLWTWARVGWLTRNTPISYMGFNSVPVPRHFAASQGRPVALIGARALCR